MRKRIKGKVALLSVYNKKGIADFAANLFGLGWTLVSSGGTAKALTEAGLPVTDVAELVGGGAILGHRVVTLSREVHAGLLARHGVPEDEKEMAELLLPFIDLVCVDMYPLEDEIARAEATEESVIEKTDIGGPTMLSAAAKARRIVICDPDDRPKVIEWLEDGEPDREEFLRLLAAKADYTVSLYRGLSAMFHGGDRYVVLGGTKKLECKYGENGYQKPAYLYSRNTDDPLALDKFELITGTAPSYNNLCDLDRLLQTLTHINAAMTLADSRGTWKIAVAAKHGNACGAAVSWRRKESIKKMVEGDPLAIFGGLVICNFHFEAEDAELLLTHKMPKGKRRLLDGLIVPSITEEAVEMLERKGDKCRILFNPTLLTSLTEKAVESLDRRSRFRYVRGGFLVQPNYTFVPLLSDPRLEKVGRQATSHQEMAMLLAKAVCDTSNSNTITLAKIHHYGSRVDAVTYHLIGNGVGQQARVHGANLAIERARTAGHNLRGAVAASDSFFPETDGPEVLAKAGIRAIFGTSGSVRDKEVKAFCRKNRVKLYLIPDSVGRGFFGH